MFNKKKQNNISVERIMDFAKSYDDLKPFFNLLTHYFSHVFESSKEIQKDIQVLEDKTGQELTGSKLLRELWGLRYVYSHIAFFDIKPPKSQEQLSDQLLTINSALKTVLKRNDKLDYLSWIQDSLLDYVGDELIIKNLKKFRKNFPEKLAEKITYIPFNATGGRLAGELYDSVAKLIMNTIDEDKRILYLEDQ